MSRSWYIKSEPTEQSEERSDENAERSDDKAKCFSRSRV